MKWITLVLPLLFSISANANQSISKSEVEQAIHSFAEAFVKAEVNTLEKFLGEPYIHVNGNSGNLVDKSNWLKWIKSRRELLDKGELKFESYQVSTLKIEIIQNTAIVTGIVKAKGIEKGKVFETNLRFSNVWIKQDGQLRRVSFHDSKLP